MMSEVVQVQLDGRVALIEINHPPVNALAHPVRAALLDQVEALERHPQVAVIILFGAGRHFIAGADVREFDYEPRAPLLNDLLLRIESCAKPVVAALHGATLGGGAELALASHFRAAAADLSFGFPEVKLGLLPGAGGTARLPRIVGTRVALDLMTSGESIAFERACELGLVDHTLTQDLKQSAFAYGRELLSSGAVARRLRDRPAPPAKDLSICQEFRGRLEKKATGNEAAISVIDAVEATLTKPFAQSLGEARRLFELRRQSVSSRALRHLFFAERAGGGRPSGAAQPIETLGIVGAGTMGSGIAISAATAGIPVILVDANPAVLAVAIEKVDAALSSSVRKGRMTQEAAAAARSRLVTADSLGAVASAPVVIEAVFENLPTKQQVFQDLGRLTRPGIVLATNTSTLDVDAIGASSGRAVDTIGLHFFSPAHVMRLVEIVPGRETSPAVIDTVSALVRQLGKTGIRVGNAFGFVGNRMLYEYGREKELLLLEGATPEQVDRALETFGMAMGPNAVGDLSGIDIGCQARKFWKERPADPRYYRVSDLLVEQGRLGQKSGAGFYTYPERGKRLVDPEVTRLITEEAQRLGIARRSIEDSEIIQRCTLALINAGARLLDEGIAQRPTDIDVIWCNGYGFPRSRGGPMFFADTLGLNRVEQQIAVLRAQYGTLYWPRSPLLEQLAHSGGTFAQLASS